MKHKTKSAWKQTHISDLIEALNKSIKKHGDLYIGVCSRSKWWSILGLELMEDDQKEKHLIIRVDD